ncbi:hypothetical protein V6N13_040106 [Hibiscus sabdariffa]
MAKALACKHALTLSKELSFRKTEVEGDALNIISKLRHPTINRSMFKAIYSNFSIKEKDFEFLTFGHIKRKNNNATHVLSGVDMSFSMSMGWIEVEAHEVEEVIRSDRWWAD